MGKYKNCLRLKFFILYIGISLSNLKSAISLLTASVLLFSLLPVKSQVTSPALFEAVLSAS